MFPLKPAKALLLLTETSAKKRLAQKVRSEPEEELANVMKSMLIGEMPQN